MRTRLSTALAILGAALLLSSIEAEGKKLFLPPPTVTLKNYREEKQKQTNKQKQKQIHLASIARSISLRFMFFSQGFLSCRETPPSPEVCPFPSSLVQISRILLNSFRTVLCGLLALVPAVCCPHCHLRCRLPRGPAVREGATAAPTSTNRIPPGATQELWRAGRSLARLVTTGLGAATSVRARNKRLQQRRLCASVCFVGSSVGQADAADK